MEIVRREHRESFITADGSSIRELAGIPSGNSANQGGGIFNDGGTVTVTGSMVQNNTASVDGGGIDNLGGTMTVRNRA